MSVAPTWERRLWRFLDAQLSPFPGRGNALLRNVLACALVIILSMSLEVPLLALLPAFMLSELKTAFLIGFQIYLPFVILDIVVASVTISMGMLMLPPVLVSLPFKLLLFVLVDGWHFVVEMLLQSFHIIS